MAYCHHCGKKNNEGASFCNTCGKKLKEIVEDVKKEVVYVEKEVEKTIKRKSHFGFVLFILFLIILGYVILDIWAATQLTPVFNLDSLISSISNTGGNVGYTSASASTTIRIENPTFVPVIVGRVVYDAGYGSTKVVDGKSGIIMVAPYSTQDLPVDASVSYVNAGVAGLKGIKNLIFGGNDKANANVYVDFFITKIKIYEWGA